MSNGPSISIGLGAQNLRDRDWLSKSDPYIVISRPSTSGSFQVLRKSETKKNCLNPDWADFLFNEREVGPHEQDLRLKFEIYDNDYNSADQLLGVTHLSLEQLEAAATLGTSLKIGGSGNGKVNAGNLVVRSFNRHGGQQSQFGQAGALGGGHQSQFGQAGPLGGGHQGQLSQSGPLGGGHQGHIGQAVPYRGQPGQGGGLSVGYPSQPVGYPPACSRGAWCVLPNKSSYLWIYSWSKWASTTPCKPTSLSSFQSSIPILSSPALPFFDPWSIFFFWLPICTHLQCSKQPINWTRRLCF